MRARVLAVFDCPQALEQALGLLGGARRLTGETQVLSAHDDLRSEPEPARWEGCGLGWGASSRCVPQRLLETTLMKEGLTVGQNRQVSGLIKQGGAALICHPPVAESGLLELLRRSGALHVVAVVERQELAPPTWPERASSPAQR